MATNAYLVSHNGLGDNLYMVGALRFIAQYYETVSFLCKYKYWANVSLFFADIPQIICIPFDESREFDEIKQIVSEKYQDPLYDIFVCGFCHKEYLTSKITNPRFLEARAVEPAGDCPTVDFDTLTTGGYGFIADFYRDIGLSLRHFYGHFEMPRTPESENLYESVADYYLVFIQLTSSDGLCLNISELLAKYLDDDRALLICNDRNLYDSEKQPKKFSLAMPFVYNKIVHYITTILNSDEIYIIDSCFTGVILPYAKRGQLKASKVRIILREMAERTVL
jgi:hypothetical protein